jgi:integrase
MQLRDLDLEGGMLTVRSGKAGKARRVPLHLDAARLLRRYLELVRCPEGLPALGSDQERERLLVGIAVTTNSGTPMLADEVPGGQNARQCGHAGVRVPVPIARLRQRWFLLQQERSVGGVSSASPFP